MANFDQNGHHARGIRPFLEMGFGALGEEFTNSSETIEEDECRESQLSFINHLPLDLTRLRGDYVGSAFRRIFPQLSNSSRHPSNLDLKVAKMSEFLETSFKIGP